MTTQEFNTYVRVQKCMMGKLGIQMEEEIATLTNVNKNTLHNMMFMSMYLDFLCRWKQENCLEDESLYTENLIPPSEAQCLSRHSDKIFGTNYCISFCIES